MRHNLTSEEVKRIFQAKDLAEADRIATEIEREREQADRGGRCEEHGRVNCGRCAAYRCPNCGPRYRAEVKQTERDECCVYVCRTCDAIAEEPALV